MSRHAAAIGADVDPVVAAALARRGPGGDAPRHSAEGAERRGPVGWPGREGDDTPEGAPGGSPVGWPGTTAREPVERPEQQPAPAPERDSVWRRLFGGSAA